MIFTEKNQTKEKKWFLSITMGLQSSFRGWELCVQLNGGQFSTRNRASRAIESESIPLRHSRGWLKGKFCVFCGWRTIQSRHKTAWRNICSIDNNAHEIMTKRRTRNPLQLSPVADCSEAVDHLKTVDDVSNRKRTKKSMNADAIVVRLDHSNALENWIDSQLLIPVVIPPSPSFSRSDNRLRFSSHRILSWIKRIIRRQPSCGSLCRSCHPIIAARQITTRTA